VGITSKVIVLFDFLAFPLLFVFLAICCILELEAATSTVFATCWIANLLFSKSKEAGKSRKAEKQGNIRFLEETKRGKKKK
jgi:hypothetical protein